MRLRPHGDPFLLIDPLYLLLQASGDVATLFLLLAQLGLHAWRDMNADDLTEAGVMRAFAVVFRDLGKQVCVKESSTAMCFASS